ncbi:MAG TPA: RNA 2',3'-cyclic phosphodiesterase [Chthoniobacterales bacterium]|nr:RNA 2',3'-cyclic phosphodiesterase [Chthoniobacterales bacterium]
MSTKRLFVSLDLPPIVAAALVRLNPQLAGVRWLPAEQLHLTLAFFGDVAPEMEEKLAGKLRVIHFARFFLPIAGVGTFPSRGEPKIIWIGVGRGHPHLFQLHKLVTDAALAAGLEPDLRPWHPHITLARCRDVSRQTIQRFLREHADAEFGLTPIDSFSLQSSRLTPAGSVYDCELRISPRA